MQLFAQAKTLDDVLNDSSKYQELLRVLNSSTVSMSSVMDTEYRALAFDKASEELTNTPNEKAIGKRVEELDYAGAILAEEFRHSERRVLVGGQSQSKILCFQRGGADSRKIVFLATKTPIVGDNGQIIGVWSESIDVSLLFLGPAHSAWDMSERFLGNGTDQVVFDLDARYEELDLSKRQAEIMFFVVRGKTSKDIAARLRISHRTVESYIDDIKVKLSCTTREQLIDVGVAKGFMGILPETLIPILAR